MRVKPKRESKPLAINFLFKGKVTRRKIVRKSKANALPDSSEQKVETNWIRCWPSLAWLVDDPATVAVQPRFPYAKNTIVTAKTMADLHIS